MGLTERMLTKTSNMAIVKAGIRAGLVCEAGRWLMPRPSRSGPFTGEPITGGQASKLKVGWRRMA
eukprot:6298217-Amphidinium_carterae.1